MNKMKLVDRLRNPQTMSKFTGTADMYEDLNLQRMLAADDIERLTAARDALRAEVEALRGQEPAAWMHPAGGVLQRLSTGLERDAYTIPLFLAAGAQGEPVVCEWREEDDFGWHTSCGATWSFFDGGPNDNGVKFCHGCGRSVHVATKPEDDQ